MTAKNAKKSTGTASVKKKSGETVAEETTNPHEVKERKKALAEVMVGIGHTKDIGNFQFLRFDVQLKLPCAAEKVDQAYDIATAWCANKLEDMVAKFAPQPPAAQPPPPAPAMPPVAPPAPMPGMPPSAPPPAPAAQSGVPDMVSQIGPGPAPAQAVGQPAAPGAAQPPPPWSDQL